MVFRRYRYYFLVGVMMTAGVSFAIWIDQRGGPGLSLPIIRDIGGDFVLSGAGGDRVNTRDYRGQVVILFFGYTHCPDVCPNSMYTLKMVMDLLDGDSDRVQVLMVTVDPERDSAGHLQGYVSYFHPRFIGLTGTQEEIAEVAKKYSAQYEKDSASSDGGYQVSHSAFFYLLDQEGRVRALHDPRSSAAQIVADVQALLADR